MSIENNNPTPAQRRNGAWSEKGPTYWKYEPGKRDKLPSKFERFYQANRFKFINVLDVGCGTGRYLIPMLQDGLHVVGIEPSEGMREGARENLKAAGLERQAQIVEGESVHLTLTDASIDLVFSKGAIHHNTWVNIQQSFAEIQRVLRKNGFFIFQGRSVKDPALAHSERIQDFGATAMEKSGWKAGVIQHYFTEAELKQLAKDNSFEVVVGPEEILKPNGSARWWVVYKKI